MRAPSDISIVDGVGAPPVGRVVVDVIRAFTTAAVVLDAGATGVLWSPPWIKPLAVRSARSAPLLGGEHRARAEHLATVLAGGAPDARAKDPHPCGGAASLRSVATLHAPVPRRAFTADIYACSAIDAHGFAMIGRVRASVSNSARCPSAARLRSDAND